MILSFNIEYRTNWGEEVRVTGNLPELGDNDCGCGLSLCTTDGIHWTGLAPVHSEQSTFLLHYNYYIWRDGEIIRKEWSSQPRCLKLSGSDTKRYTIFDSWKNIPEDLSFYSSAFTEAILARKDYQPLHLTCRKSILFKVYAPQVEPDCCLALCGNQPSLGNWDAAKAVPMSDENFPEWQVELDVQDLHFPLEYKFVILHKSDSKLLAWEENPNRYLSKPSVSDNETLVIGDRYVTFNTARWKGAGVAVPVFSLRSEKSFGVGDFADLKRMVDWLVSTDQRVIQILPVNDTTITHKWTDSYPYSSISIYAFHPMYANLEAMGCLKDAAKMKHFDEEQSRLNALPTVDYEAVNDLKWEYFRLLFEQEGKDVLSSLDYLRFFTSNKEWLQPYAVFSYLRDKYRTADFHQWPEHSVYKTADIEKMCRKNAPHYKDISIYFYVQYHLHMQLSAAHTYARSKGVVLKGDIPIGISRNSVEAWTEPYYFNLDGQAGAPPDDFSVNGQNWGFPTYNWDAMAKDGYAWWMRRFKKMAEYFDAYRIDHILGFFRIWEIPMDAVHGLLGQFVPSLPMSKEEIESYGLSFRETYLQPYIHEYFLKQVFGPHTDYVKEHFIEQTNMWEVYKMRKEFDTQRKIEQYFDQKTDEASMWMREGLYALVSDVLFVRDHRHPDMYHPRIAAQHDFAYRSLNEGEKAAFNRLYDDYFYHRHNEFWREQAMKKLPQLTQSTRMLVCGEDLGMIPACVAWVMNDLRILSLEIQGMPKNPTQEFGRPTEYPFRSVCTISTHDMATLREWWQEDAGRAQRYYNNMLGHYGAAPAQASPELCEEIVRNNLYGSSMLCILSLQDWLSTDGKYRNSNAKEERINVPANPKHYWRYKMHLTIEELLKADDLNRRIRTLIKQTGRGSGNLK